MQKKYDAILFDFDFTLADSLKGTVHCINHALAKINVNSFMEKDFTSIMGYTIPDIFKHLTGIEDESILKNFLLHYKPYADKVLADMTILNNDAIDILTYLKNKNYKLGIVSTKHRYRINEVLNKYGIIEMIDIVIGQEDIQNRKPDPEGLQKAINYLNTHKIHVKFAELWSLP